MMVQSNGKNLWERDQWSPIINPVHQYFMIIRYLLAALLQNHFTLMMRMMGSNFGNMKVILIKLHLLRTMELYILPIPKVWYMDSIPNLEICWVGNYLEVSWLQRDQCWLTTI